MSFAYRASAPAFLWNGADRCCWPDRLHAGTASQRNAPTLQFVVVSAPEAIKQWKARPVVAFAGFDAVKYGFTRAEFYRWHVPVPGREDFDGTTSSKDRLALAIRVVNSAGERWFELTAREKESEDVETVACDCTPK